MEREKVEPSYSIFSGIFTSSERGESSLYLDYTASCKEGKQAILHRDMGGEKELPQA